MAQSINLGRDGIGYPVGYSDLGPRRTSERGDVYINAQHHLQALRQIHYDMKTIE